MQDKAIAGKELRSAYVLDDEPQVVGLVCKLLTAHGFAARPFVAAMPLLAEVKNSPPELIVLDLALGQSDAVEVIRHLQVLKYKGKVLLISGKDESTLARIKEIGASRELLMLTPLQKPFRAGDLKRALEEAPPEPREQTAEQSPSSQRVAVDLGQALRNRWLELWYQPKIDLRSMQICGAEALLRARHPTHGIITPASLLPPPRDPMYQPLTNFVISQALVDWTHFAEHQVLLKSAVNVPVSALQATDFIAGIREHLPRNPNFPGMIFEITEDEAIEEPSLLQEIAGQLKIYNISLSIDDFGSGFSSLSRLRDLPFTEIKLDRSFVANCSTDGSKQSLCNAAIELAHGFGASVCAEGVETMEDLRTLIGMRCDTAQGFLFAKPMDSQTFERSLVARPEKLTGQADRAA